MSRTPVNRFDRRADDSLCDPVWWPEGRYLKSAALDAVKQVELAAAEAGDEAMRSLLSYAGQLGAALLVTKFASRGLFAGLPRVVGFDSGDLAVLDDRSGPAQGAISSS